MRNRAARLFRRRLHVLYNNQQFTRTDEPQFLARLRLNCSGIRPQPFRSFTQPRIFRAKPSDSGREVPRLLARACRGHQPSFADKCIHEQDDGCKDKQVVQRPTPQRTRGGQRCHTLPPERLDTIATANSRSRGLWDHRHRFGKRPLYNSFRPKGPRVVGVRRGSQLMVGAVDEC